MAWRGVAVQGAYKNYGMLDLGSPEVAALSSVLVGRSMHFAKLEMPGFW